MPVFMHTNPGLMCLSGVHPGETFGDQTILHSSTALMAHQTRLRVRLLPGMTRQPGLVCTFFQKYERTVPLGASASGEPSPSLPAACAPFYQIVKRRQFRLHKIAAFLFHNLIVSLTEVSFFQENLPHSFPLLRLPVRL